MGSCFTNTAAVMNDFAAEASVWGPDMRGGVASAVNTLGWDSTDCTAEPLALAGSLACLSRVKKGILSGDVFSSAGCVIIQDGEANRWGGPSWKRECGRHRAGRVELPCLPLCPRPNGGGRMWTGPFIVVSPEGTQEAHARGQDWIILVATRRSSRPQRSDSWPCRDKGWGQGPRSTIVSKGAEAGLDGWVCFLKAPRSPLPKAFTIS